MFQFHNRFRRLATQICDNLIHKNFTISLGNRLFAFAAFRSLCDVAQSGDTEGETVFFVFRSLKKSSKLTSTPLTIWRIQPLCTCKCFFMLLKFNNSSCKNNCDVTKPCSCMLNWPFRWAAGTLLLQQRQRKSLMSHLWFYDLYSKEAAVIF